MATSIPAPRRLRNFWPALRGPLVFAGLVAAGMAGNHFRLPMMFNVDLVFGSIFALLALELYGLGAGVAAALLISSPLMALWGHPYGLVLMTAEVAAVGWLNRRWRIGLIQADLVYWFLIGMPLVYACYHLVMKLPADTTRLIMVKDAVNGLANVLLARLASAQILRARGRRIPHAESIYILLALFVVVPSLTLLVAGGRRDLAETQERIRARLAEDGRHMTGALDRWVAERQQAMVTLAGLAAAMPPAQMQARLEQARLSDSNFLRVGLVDRDAVSVAFDPPVDETGQSNLGRHLADRPFIHALRQTLRPVLSEVILAGLGNPVPIVSMLAPVVRGGAYAGFATGVLNLAPIRARLDYLHGPGMRFALLDRDGLVIMTNLSGQRIMAKFDRGPGTLRPLDGGLGQWLPSMAANTPATERWSRSSYVMESTIGPLAEWRLVLEQPVAPYQHALFADCFRDLGTLLLLLAASLALAELVSRTYASALAESEARMGAIADTAHDAIVIIDQEGRITYWNRAAARVFGHSPEAALGRNLHRLLVNEQHLEAHLAGFPGFQRTGRGEAIGATFELEARHRDGHVLLVEVSISALRLQGRWHAVGILRDITSRKQAEAEQAELEARLQHARRMDSLGTLVAGVAHNLNNVLAVVLGTASLRSQLAADPADLEAYRSIGEVSRRGRAVIKSLIHFSRPTLATQAPFELHGVIREIRSLLAATTRDRRILAELDAEPVWIHGDAGSLNLALMNLGFNALEAMPRGGTLAFRTRTAEAGWVEVAVEDDGAGMSPEVLARVTEPFFTTREAGSGLGLSLAYGVTRAHGGVMEIHSQPGEGTQVTLRLPRIPAPAPAQETALAAPEPGPLKVFLVDDDEDVRFLMTRMLRKSGAHRVQTFNGGEAVLERLRAGDVPDLLILDQNMPGMNGIQTLEAVRGLVPELPVLISSGQPDIEGWDCFRRPGVAVIAKPFTMEEIQVRLAQFAAE